MEENNWFKTSAPEFRLNGDKIKVLYTPEQFFSTLKNLLPTAKRRIVISSLYVGTGELEKQLVDGIHQALSKSNENLKVQILLDYTRGSRGQISSRTMLLPLLSRQQDVQIAFYHTPDLRGLSKRFLPERWNEVIGLAHMKIYVVDDVVLISGANLSHDYFTNRQDRYVVMQDGSLANFFQSLVATVSTFSIQLHPDNSESLHKDWKIHPFKGDYHAFKSEVKNRMEDLISVWKSNSLSDENCPPSTKLLLNQLGINRLQSKAVDADSWVYPLIQMGPFNIRYDETTTESLFCTASSKSRIHLATGYFNLTPQYEHVIAKESKAEFNILTASPKANGFFAGKGISAFIPKLYLYIAKLFLKEVQVEHQDKRIFVHEYERCNWTFHGKGLWYYPPSSLLPSVTLIGSPNFGCRSVCRDLESQVAIVTSNVALMKQLHNEQQKLFQHSSVLTDSVLILPERHIPLWVRIFSKVFRNYF